MRKDIEPSAEQSPQTFSRSDVIELLNWLPTASPYYANGRRWGDSFLNPYCTVRPEGIINDFIEYKQKQQAALIKHDAQEVKGPVYLNPKKLYHLKEDEKILFRVEVPSTSEEILNEKRFSIKEIEKDHRVQELYNEAVEGARKMESGSVLTEAGDSFIELQGYYKNIKVVPAKDPVRGYRTKGWALIGTRKSPEEIVHQQ